MEGQPKILSKWVLPLVAAGVLGLASAPSAHGVATLSISDGLGHTLNLRSSSSGITYTGNMVNFSLNITCVVATMIAIFVSGFVSTSFGTTVKDPVVVGPVTPVVTVPDAGATAPLLGLALLGIGLVRRKLIAL